MWRKEQKFSHLTQVEGERKIWEVPTFIRSSFKKDPKQPMYCTLLTFKILAGLLFHYVLTNPNAFWLLNKMDLLLLPKPLAS